MDSGATYVIRIKIPRNEEVRVQDIIRGWVVVHTSQMDDKVLFKSDGMPTYHLANVVDDYTMQITHVISGEEWLPSAPLHLLLYKYLGWEKVMPQFAHLPLLLKPDGNGKLSKRDGNRPIAGVLFANLTKRTIDGQFSGGDSRLSLIYIHDNDPSASDLVRVKVEAANQCFEQELTLDEAHGKFVFRNLPPMVMDVKVTLHTDPTIYDYMQLQGGQTKDMRNKMRDTVDFRYYAPPQVWMEPFEQTLCTNGNSTPYPTLDESNPSNDFKVYKKTIRMYEDYTGGRDWLNHFDLTIINDLNENAPVSFEVRDTNAFLFKYYASKPNISGDFTKFMQVKGTTARGIENVATQRAIVLGERPRESFRQFIG